MTKQLVRAETSYKTEVQRSNTRKGLGTPAYCDALRCVARQRGGSCSNLWRVFPGLFFSKGYANPHVPLFLLSLTQVLTRGKLCLQTGFLLIVCNSQRQGVGARPEEIISVILETLYGTLCFQYEKYMLENLYIGNTMRGFKFLQK